ncbi:hypothetical protein D9757_005941 [Collybiopsis confluens]|uniref:Uncharacterized protein n=1 Tax=Collybiopsis confluens TaxID=2823264 RepID=A0A8H5HN64_9AGAR|nr:hypothetical protein D9757_005941 [Collybiopsis confluens]
MESSLNLNTLASSLPTPYQNAEKELLNNFKAAALSITTLYRSSRNASKRAFNAGYASACNDILLMIQQGVSVEGIQQNHGSSGPRSDPNPPFDAEGQGMTIGKVMDWIEARMEAIKSREEEEDEEEEKERERANPNASNSASASSSKSVSRPSKAPNNKHTREQDPTQSTSNPATNPPLQSHSDSQPASPSLPPTTPRQSQRLPNKHSRAHTQSKGEPSISPGPQLPSLDGAFIPSSTFDFVPADHAAFPTMTSSSPPLSVSAVSPFSPLPDNVSAVAAGAKRRHAVMMMLDSSSAPSSFSSGGSSSSTPSASPGFAHAGSRRRTRSARNNNQNLGLNVGVASEAMDIEEDGGRERKRVARR